MTNSDMARPADQALVNDAPTGHRPSGFDPSRDDQLTEILRADAESRLVMDIARHAADRVHEITKVHAVSLPTVSAAVGFGLVLAQQIYAETLLFAANSMEGDEEDAQAIRDSAGVLMRDLLDVIDITEVKDWSGAERGRFYRDSDGNPKGGDGTAPSRSDDSAGLKGIAETPVDLSSRDTNNVG